MAQQTINTGTILDDGTGESTRDSFEKCNDNFDELYSGVNKTITTTQIEYKLAKSLTTGIADDTYFDLMKFLTIGIPSLSEYGIITGDLVIVVKGQNSVSQPINQTLVYRISISYTQSGLFQMASTLTTVGTDNMGSGTNITATLNEKSASASNIVLEWKMTFANFTANNSIFATFNGQCLSDSADTQIVPTFEI